MDRRDLSPEPVQSRACLALRRRACPVYSVDGSGFAGLPDANALKLSQWSKANNSGLRNLLNP